MSPIPIRLPTVEVHMHADRRLAFQVITAFDAPSETDGPSTRVLSREDNRLLVEFKTPVKGLLGGHKVYRTVECVTLHEPDRIDPEGVEGPLPLLHDRFTLDQEQGCTLFRYESEFGVRGWVLGWIIGMLYVKPKMKRFIREHVEEMKQTIEARAERSKKFPRQPCTLVAVEGENAA